MIEGAESDRGQTMLDLIEIELTRVRRMAEHAGDSLLLYFIDIAIIEANRKARSVRQDPDEFATKHPEREASRDDD